MQKPVSAGIRKKKAAAAKLQMRQQRSNRDQSLSAQARSSRSSKREELEKITIKTPTGKLLEMDVTRHETPAELKERLEGDPHNLGPVGDHRIVFAGKSLEDDKTLGESGVQHKAILRLQKPSAWTAHLKNYNYSTLQYWDKSTQQAQTRVKKTKPPPRPKSPASSEEEE